MPFMVLMAIKPVFTAATSTALQESLAFIEKRLRLVAETLMVAGDTILGGFPNAEFAQQAAMKLLSAAGQGVGREWQIGIAAGGDNAALRASLPNGPDVAELTRAVVAGPVRRQGIYRLAMLETVLSLRALGARLATAAIEPDFPGRRFLLELGFLAVGAPVMFDDLPRSRTLAQPIALKLDARGERRCEAMRRAQHHRLLAAGYIVESESLAGRMG